MESNMAGFVLNASALESMYNQVKDDGFIDLGLSLKTLHTQSCYPVDQSSQNLHVDQTIVSGGYNEPMEWTYLRSVHLKSPKCSGTNQDDCAGEDLEGVQSKERWGYVKVNMEGIVVGRKISLADHIGYPSLALQLEDMFGGLTAYGLRLFQCGSEFVLVYKDGEEKWWSAGDVPWKEFVDCAKRLRIVRKKKVLIS